jgi:capsular exopolysaccharide synthesis family protein
MDLSWLFAAARRRWRVLLLIFLLGPLVAGAQSALTPVQYRATSTVIFAVDGATTVRELVDGGTYVQQVAPSYAQLAESPAVLSAVIASLGLNVTPTVLARRINVEIRNGELLAQISADAATGPDAAAIANEVAVQLGVDVGRLSRGAGGSSLPISLTTVSPATPPAAPFAPDFRRAALLGLAGGLVLASVFLYLREAVASTVRTKADIGQVTDVPVLGTVARDPRAKRRPLPLDTHPHVPRSESYWMLRNTILPRFGEESNVLAVVSPRRGEGRTSVAANLAIALAHAGQRVLLLEGDLRGRGLGSLFHLQGTQGVASVLGSRATLAQAVQRWSPRTPRGYGIDVLTAEEMADDEAVVLVASQRMTHLLDVASKAYDLVIVDTPALLDGTSGTLLAAQSDAVLVVADASSTEGRDLAEVLNRLSAVALVLGIVLNNVPQDRRRTSRRADRSVGRPQTESRPPAPVGPVDGWWLDHKAPDELDPSVDAPQAEPPPTRRPVAPAPADRTPATPAPAPAPPAPAPAPVAPALAPQATANGRPPAAPVAPGGADDPSADHPSVDHPPTAPPAGLGNGKQTPAHARESLRRAVAPRPSVYDHPQGSTTQTWRPPAGEETAPPPARLPSIHLSEIRQLAAELRTAHLTSQKNAPDDSDGATSPAPGEQA